MEPLRGRRVLDVAGGGGDRLRRSRWTRRLALLGGLFALVQVVPYGRDHTNPPTNAEPDWDTAATRDVFFRVCRDCHSNETRWPWYSHVAPVSWLVQHDVDEGRSHFNVSDWSRAAKQHGDEAAEMVREGEMPPWFYLPLHAEARLAPAEQERFVAGLARTFGDDSPDGHDHDDHEH